MPAGQFAPSRIHLDYPEWTPPAVGDTGKFWVWNNATQKYEQANNIRVGSNSSSDDAGVLVTRNAVGTGPHAFRDETRFTATDNDSGYGAFDAITYVYGDTAYNHIAGFQARQIYYGGGSVGEMRGFWSSHNHQGSGTITRSKQFIVTDPVGSGPITHNYGLYIENLSRGASSNYAIYSLHAGDSFFNGRVLSTVFKASTALVSSAIRPLADTTTAVSVQDASGSNNIVVVDSVSRRVGVNKTPSTARLEIAQVTGSMERLLDFYDNNGVSRLVLFSNGSLQASAIPSTSGVQSNSPGAIDFYGTWWNGSTTVNDTFTARYTMFGPAAGYGAFYLRNTTTNNVGVAVSGGSKGQIAIGDLFPSDFQSSKGKLWVVSPDTAWKAATFHVLTGASVDIVDFEKNGVVQFAIGNDGKLKTNQSVTNTNTPSGATVKALPLYNASGTLDGYIPVYASPW